MDQVKIGKFIAERRKIKDLTQMQLAEMLGITDRAVSKWETGRSLPDSSLMLTLCGILGISVNDLLSGEVVTMDNYKEELENNLIEMVKEKEMADKRLLRMEVVVGVTSVALLLAFVFIAAFVPMRTWLRANLTVLGFLLAGGGAAYALRIEQVAGYYECTRCGHTSVPSYKSVFFARHIGRTRYLHCSQCNERLWHKKVISKQNSTNERRNPMAPLWGRILAIVLAVVLIVFVVLFTIYDMKDRHYQCPECEAVFEPTVGEYLLGSHVGSRRTLTCHECGERSLCEKVKGD